MGKQTFYLGLVIILFIELVSVSAAETVVAEDASELGSSKIKRHMIEGSSQSALSLSDNGSDDLYFSLGIGHSYLFNDWTQISSKLRYSNASYSRSYSLKIGPTFNFFESVAGQVNDAFFIGLKAGVDVYKFKHDNSFGLDLDNKFVSFISSIELGKRFPLASNISWSPSVSANYTKLDSSKSTYYSVNLLNLNFFF